jgi:hypothetical protein
MQNIATQFTQSMQQAEDYIDLASSAFDLAKHDYKNLRSKHPIAVNAIDVCKKARKLGSTVEVYDGSYLSICAQYEQTVRKLVEVFTNELNAKIPIYSNLPEKIRQWYPKGCSMILLNGREKYQYINQDAIMGSLASCVKCSLKKPYSLIPEAFSDHDHNLRDGVIEVIFGERLGLQKVWQKLSHEVILSTYLGSTNPLTTEQLARSKLNGAMLQRNNIIHRGQGFHHPGESELSDTARYFNVLISSLANVLDKYLAAV